MLLQINIYAILYLFNMAFLTRLREYVESIVDWTFLTKLRLHIFIYIFLCIDFWGCLAIFIPSAMSHFLYVNPGGPASFVDIRRIRHQDMYAFRRYQPWELQTTEDETPELIKLNSTRTLLDKMCSHYRTAEKLPGDPGDYLKEVAGRPFSSGYNSRVSHINRLWITAVCITYLSTPMMLLSIWWKKFRTKILVTYMIVQLIPLGMLYGVCRLLVHPLMCGVNVIYGRAQVKTFIVGTSIAFTVYTCFKFVVMFLYIVERHLEHRRRDRGYPERRILRMAVSMPLPFKHLKMEQDGEEEVEHEQEASDSEMEVSEVEDEVKEENKIGKKTSVVVVEDEYIENV